MPTDTTRPTPGLAPGLAPRAAAYASSHATLAPAIAGPVLLACDGAAPSDAAALAARRAAERLGTTIDVVAVLPLLPSVGIYPGVATLMPAALEAERRDALRAAVVRRLEPVLGSGERWRLHLAYGPIGRAIADVARERGSGLVVLGTGGHRVRDRLLGEEVSLQVVRHASCPVLAVAPGLRKPIRRAVVGVDFSAASVRAALAALALLDPGPDGAGMLVLVHVRSPFEATYPVLGPWASDYDQRVVAQLVRLREILRPHLPDGVTVETRSRVGAVPATLLETADERGAQVVAVGTHGAGWLERLFVGSVATGALRHAGRSVLVTPAPNAIDRMRLELELGGEVVLERPDDWAAALDAFTRRNLGRRARLHVRDATSGPPHVESAGYAFVGATYDPHDQRIELMLGEDPSRVRRLTHGISRVHAIEIVARDEGSTDELLLVRGEAGDTVLSFADDDTITAS